MRVKICWPNVALVAGLMTGILLSGQEAPERPKVYGGTAKFWVRSYDPEGNYLRLEPVLPAAFLVQPEVLYPAIVRREGQVVDCKFEATTAVLTAPNGSMVKLNKPYLVCDGFRMGISHTLFQGER